jgi:drug/metabolite transporter (DMT)-like permease
VLLWAFTAILGRLITLPAVELVAWRLLLVVALVALLPPVWRAVRRVPPRRVLVYLGIGAVVALHWLAFYGAIKASNASVATICLAIAPVTIALFEPLLQRGRPQRGDLLLGLVVVPGIVMIAGGLPAAMSAGVSLGIAAAVLAALFMMLNKRWAADHDPLAVTALEFAGGLLVALGAVVVAGRSGLALDWPTGRDLGLLAVLAIACTLLPFALSLLALRSVSAFTAQLAVNLEPIYAMALAAWLLGEARELDPTFYGGAGIVILAVLAHGLGTSRADAGRG